MVNSGFWDLSIFHKIKIFLELFLVFNALGKENIFNEKVLRVKTYNREYPRLPETLILTGVGGWGCVSSFSLGFLLPLLAFLPPGDSFCSLSAASSVNPVQDISGYTGSVQPVCRLRHNCLRGTLLQRGNIFSRLWLCRYFLCLSHFQAMKGRLRYLKLGP